MSDRRKIIDEAPDLINVVLTFQEPDGNRWLAGALLGPLQAENGTETLRVPEMLDRVLALVDFRVVRDGPSDAA